MAKNTTNLTEKVVSALKSVLSTSTDPKNEPASTNINVVADDKEDSLPLDKENLEEKVEEKEKDFMSDEPPVATEDEKDSVPDVPLTDDERGEKPAPKELSDSLGPPPFTITTEDNPLITYGFDTAPFAYKFPEEEERDIRELEEPRGIRRGISTEGPFVALDESLRENLTEYGEIPKSLWGSSSVNDLIDDAKAESNDPTNLKGLNATRGTINVCAPCPVNFAFNNPIYSSELKTSIDNKPIFWVKINDGLILGVTDEDGHPYDVALSLHLDNTGQFTLIQYQALEHPIPSDPNEFLTDDVGIGYTVSGACGTACGGILFNIRDDGIQARCTAIRWDETEGVEINEEVLLSASWVSDAVDEAETASGKTLEPLNAAKNTLNITEGVDELKNVGFKVTTGTDSNIDTSVDGGDITWVKVDHHLVLGVTGYVSATEYEKVALSLHLTPDGGGKVGVVQYEALEHPIASNPNEWLTGLTDTPPYPGVEFIAMDHDDDTAEGRINLNVRDDGLAAFDDQDSASVCKCTAGKTTSGNVITGEDPDPEPPTHALHADESGADSPPTIIREIAHGGVTYTLNATNDGIDTTAAPSTYDYSSGVLTIFETQYSGELVIDMNGSNPGDYTYEAPDTLVSAKFDSLKVPGFVTVKGFEYDGTEIDPYLVIPGGPRPPRGFGVDTPNEGTDDRFQEINYRQGDDKSEMLSFKLADDVTAKWARVTVSWFFTEESNVGTEKLFWAAYAQGNPTPIKTGVANAEVPIGVSAPDAERGLKTFYIVNVPDGFNEIQFSAIRGNPDYGIGLDDTSDYYVQSVQFCGIEGLDEQFTYTIEDADGDQASASLTISVSSPVGNLMEGNDCNNCIKGTDDADLIFAYGGNDTINGKDGDDTISGEEGNDKIYAGSGNDVIFGDAGRDTISGGDDNDCIKGGTGNDRIYGQAGDDTIEGGLGADSLNGGNDTDTVSYESSYAGVNINLNTPSASGGHANGDTISGFENVIGSEYDDTLKGDSNDNVLEGLGGDDIIIGRGGDDSLYGNDGDDTLLGNINDDSVLDGGDGLDTLNFAANETGISFMDLSTFDPLSDSLPLSNIEILDMRDSDLVGDVLKINKDAVLELGTQNSNTSEALSRVTSDPDTLKTKVDIYVKGESDDTVELHGATITEWEKQDNQITMDGDDYDVYVNTSDNDAVIAIHEDVNVEETTS